MLCVAKVCLTVAKTTSIIIHCDVFCILLYCLYITLHYIIIIGSLICIIVFTLLYNYG